MALFMVFMLVHKAKFHAGTKCAHYFDRENTLIALQIKIDFIAMNAEKPERICDMNMVFADMYGVEELDALAQKAKKINCLNKQPDASKPDEDGKRTAQTVISDEMVDRLW